MAITLEQLLSSREDRWNHQMELLSSHPGLTLVCLTVIMPGDVKRNHQSLAVAHAAVEALRKAFSDEIEERDLKTGYEAYLLTPIPQLEAKRMVCNIEEEHPLGRLFDLDVITPEGIPLPRSAINRSPRQCLLCQQEARFCMRNHTHTREELQQRIDEMVTEFMREKK